MAEPCLDALDSLRSRQRLRRSAYARRSVALAGWLLAVALWLHLPGQALGQIITQTPGRNLNFGGCDNVGSATYTVAAAASPGAGACFGAMSAEFTVTHGTPGPHRRIRIRFTSATATLVNGAASLNVALTKSVSNVAFCMPAAGLTVYVGGSLTLPAGGASAFGVYVGPGTLNAVYAGGGTPCP